jgi:hypothetical protein
MAVSISWGITETRGYHVRPRPAHPYPSTLELRESAPAPEPLRIASLWARVGDAEQTAEWLERAYQERSMALPFLGVLPVYERARSHPKVLSILKEMKLKSPGERD